MNCVICNIFYVCVAVLMLIIIAFTFYAISGDSDVKEICNKVKAALNKWDKKEIKQ